MDQYLNPMIGIQIMNMQNKNLISFLDFSFYTYADKSKVTMKSEYNNLKFYYIANSLDYGRIDLLGSIEQIN